MPLIYDPTGEPIEVAEGRGDLRWSSVPLNHWPEGGGYTPGALRLNSGVVSYGRVFASQVWVAAVVMRMLTWSVRVPLKLYLRTGDDSRERLTHVEGHRLFHPLARALVEPWEGGTQADLVQGLLGPTLVHGNGVTEVEDGARDQLRFEHFDWRGCKPIKIDGHIAGWEYAPTVEDAPRTVPADQALHIAWWSPLGRLGISPLAQLGTTLDIEDSAQRYQRGLFRNGARPPSAIMASEAWLGLDPDDRQALLAQLREDVNRLYAGSENFGRPAVLPPGLTWEQVGHSAVEAALIDQRRVAREEVAAVYMMPPPLVGIWDRSTLENTALAREIGYTDALGPPLVLIEQRLTGLICRRLLRRDDLYLEFDFGGVLRGDRLREIEAMREGIATGVMTPNEARRTLNLPRAEQEGMDEFYLPTNNLTPVGGDSDLGDRSLAAQRLALAVKNGLLTAEEARALIDMHGPAPRPAEAADPA